MIAARTVDRLSDDLIVHCFDPDALQRIARRITAVYGHAVLIDLIVHALLTLAGDAGAIDVALADGDDVEDADDLPVLEVGFSPSRLPRYLAVKSGETVCVEDPSSRFYNTITKRSQIGTVNADDMGSNPLYRRGLFVEYPSNRAGRRGSCIFIHIWSAPNIGTAGCIGLPEGRVRALQTFAQAGAVLAVLPGFALDRFANCLPVATMRPVGSGHR
jgi:hypothetical protein